MNETEILNTTLNKLGISPEELRAFSRHYNDDYQAYGNEIYEDIKVRLVHLDNFLKDNWWNNRFHFLWRDFSKYVQIIDFGFSVPYLPVKLALENKLSILPRLLYVDKNDTSMKMSEIILNSIGSGATYVTGNVLDNKVWTEIDEKILEGKKLFTAFETIEHYDNPEQFWKELHKYKSEDLILSLPIGEEIPSHHLVFSNQEEVNKYLSEYVNIKEYRVFNGKEAGSNYKIYTAICEIK